MSPKKPPAPGLGARIRDARMAKGMTAAEASRRIGLSASAVSHWETGHVTPPLLMLERLATELGLSVDQFLVATPTLDDQASQIIGRLSDLLARIPPERRGLILALLSELEQHYPR